MIILKQVRKVFPNAKKIGEILVKMRGEEISRTITICIEDSYLNEEFDDCEMEIKITYEHITVDVAYIRHQQTIAELMTFTKERTMGRTSKEDLQELLVVISGLIE